MYPGLLVLSPDYARSILNYRSKNLGAAMQNAKKYNVSGSLYPWTGYDLTVHMLTTAPVSGNVPAWGHVSIMNTISTTISPSHNGNTTSPPQITRGSMSVVFQSLKQ